MPKEEEHPNTNHPGRGSGQARRSLIDKVRRAIRLRPAQWADLFVAAAALLKARVVFGQLEPRELIDRLTTKTSDLHVAKTVPKDADPETIRLIQRLDWSIATAGNNVPWRSDCLVRCLAADAMLKKHGLTPEFHIGVAKTGNDPFAAHAWIYCQGLPVAGGDGEGFEVLIGPDRST